MVKAIVIEPEVAEALKCIENEENFILTGGAGSGKTHSLVSLIGEVSRRYPFKPIVCITYTNNAVYEIRERINYEKLSVFTIHEFLWDIIKKFQNEIKETLVELINDESEKLFKKPEGINVIDRDYFGDYKVNYDEYYRIKNDQDSIISHDQLLVLAEVMFKKYRKLCDILKDTAQLILVDEYQDTVLRVVRILLKHLTQSPKKCLVGFFGDSMQSIYDDGVGSIDDYVLQKISKKENRRNPMAVIKLGDKLRDDGLEQEPSEDPSAPNMKGGKIVKGRITFLYAMDPMSNQEAFESLEKIKKTSELFSSWEFNDKETKELWLTHSFNAKKAKFESLYKLYYKDPVYELIRKLKKWEFDEDELRSGITFGELAKANEPVFNNRKRGNLYQNVLSENLDKLNLISDKPWSEVKEYNLNKDSLLSYKYDYLTNTYNAKTSRDPILRQLDDIYEIIELYKQNNIKSFLRKCAYPLASLNDKKALAIIMKKLINFEEKNQTIKEVLDYVRKNNLTVEREHFYKYIEGNGYYLWECVKDIAFWEYVQSIKYQKEYLPFATQHSVKGSEYNNVLVVLDNGKWNKYNFHNFFLDCGNNNVKNRTRKLLYVCVTRTKKELVVFMVLKRPEGERILAKAEHLFGAENIIDIATLL